MCNNATNDLQIISVAAEDKNFWKTQTRKWTHFHSGFLIEKKSDAIFLCGKHFMRREGSPSHFLLGLPCSTTPLYKKMKIFLSL